MISELWLSSAHYVQFELQRIMLVELIVCLFENELVRISHYRNHTKSMSQYFIVDD